MFNQLCAQKTYFVNQTVQNGQQNGISWADAFPDLQQAISIAISSDTIWVAAGIYYPGQNGDRTISFLLKNGVKIYGGFSGTESNVTQRNWALNKTILSGDIGIPNNGSDNSYHVIYCSGVDSTTVLDGFTITKGGAMGGTANYSDTWGGGMLIEPSWSTPVTCPLIENCTFTDNYAQSGGAIYCAWNFDNVATPALRNCQFSFNRALGFAGAIYKQGPTGVGHPFVIEHCHFSDNSARINYGGAILLENTGNLTILKKCTFERDSAISSWGGAIYYGGFADAFIGGQLLLDSCDFIDNISIEGAGIAYIDQQGSQAFFKIDMKNCIFLRNTARTGEGGAIFCVSSGHTKLKYQLTDCFFKDNKTAGYGTVQVAGDSVYFNVTNSQFINNTTPLGSHYTLASSGKFIRGEITNSLFAKNNGGVRFSNSADGNIITNISSCTFYKNKDFVISKTWYPSFATSDSFRNDCYVTNCIFWEPESGISELFANTNTTELTKYGFHIDYSLVSIQSQNPLPGASESYGDHMFFHPVDPMFEDPTMGNYNLKNCSPAVNAGDNATAINSGLLFDLNKKARIYKDTIDMGAFETQSSCFTSQTKEESTTEVAYVYPNPVQRGNIFTLQVPINKIQQIQWELRDASGTVHAYGPEQAFPLQKVTLKAPSHSGVYFLQLQGEQLVETIKIIVL